MKKAIEVSAAEVLKFQMLKYWRIWSDVYLKWDVCYS